MFNVGERLLKKVLVIHFILLVLFQGFSFYYPILPYLNKLVQYEGVHKPLSLDEVLESAKKYFEEKILQ